MAITSIRLQSDIEPNLEKLATKLHRSKNWLINQAIREYIEKDQIESKRWEETLLALESVKNGKEIPEEKVDIWLQSWGTKNEEQAPEL
ncbi:MAG: transcriptional regulator [Desulfobacterales bacterium S5133MH16]|nr:MAG: transcriptional regulator [Desulfobacterales bacterium S5133MH16]